MVLDTTGIEGLFDNVRLDSSPVPEPTTIAMASAAIGLFWIRRSVGARN